MSLANLAVLIFTLMSIGIIHSVMRRPFVGKDDLKFCQDRYGKTCQGTFYSVEDPTNCLIYCNCSFTILRTWRPELSFCGIDHFCQKGECVYDDANLRSQCEKENYEVGERNEQAPCTFYCYKKSLPDRISPSKKLPKGTKCSNANDLGAYGECDNDGRCVSTGHLPLTP